ncbi:MULTISPECIES: transposase [unclassified Moraxella]|uniref:transposase n=1 Tax=unclassified Moraxella TaxID=2685852 RepID=UPI003AF77981
MAYNPEIHHRQSVRLKGYDYASVGYYFITICCVERMPLFGNIRNGQMCLNHHGLVAHQEWLNTIEKRKDLLLDEFVVMPNHMHAIVHIQQNLTSTTPNTLQSPSNNLGAIVRGYKSAVTSQLKSTLGFSPWQRNYHEHIIRNETAYQTIAQYIVNNPLTWQDDCFYTEC